MFDLAGLVIMLFWLRCPTVIDGLCAGVREAVMTTAAALEVFPEDAELLAWVADGLASPYLRDKDAGLAWAGDGCVPNGVPSGIEAAWTSGNALGKAL